MNNPNFKNSQIILDGFDFTVDEGNNTFIALRKVKWGENGTPRLDLRKYLINADGEEVMQKGVGMITEEGPHELTKVLVEQGYGHTGDLITALRTRDDFVKELTDNYLKFNPIEDEESADTDIISEEDEEELYDISEEGVI